MDAYTSRKPNLPNVPAVPIQSMSKDRMPLWRESFHQLMESQGLSRRTESVYAHWIHEFLGFHAERMSGVEWREPDAKLAALFLSHLAVSKGYSRSTQRQAFNALQHFYTGILHQPSADWRAVASCDRSAAVPVTLSRSEVLAVLKSLRWDYQLPARLIYGCGLRLAELLRIRVQDVDLKSCQLRVRDFQDRFQRTMPLPKSLDEKLNSQIRAIRKVWELDQVAQTVACRLARAASVATPKVPSEWPQFWLFPAPGSHITPKSSNWPRPHQAEDNLQRALRRSSEDAGIQKLVSPEVLRHTFAVHLLEDGVDLSVVHSLLGHRPPSSEPIYAQFVQRTLEAVVSPLDRLLEG